MSRDVHAAEVAADAGKAQAHLRTESACNLHTSGIPQAPDSSPVRTPRASTSALVVGRARAQIATVESMETMGLSVRELAAALDVSESHPRRWVTGSKPVPLSIMFSSGVPGALFLGLVDRAHALRGKTSAEAALRTALARVERDGGVERAVLLDLMAKLGELAGKTKR